MHFLNLFYTLMTFQLLSLTVSAIPPKDTNYNEEEVPQYKLPELLIDNEGRSVNLRQWEEQRRAEILSLFETHVYGKTPEKKLSVMYKVIESDKEAFNGLATRKQIAAFFGEKKFRIDLLLYIPNNVERPVPAFAGLNFNGNHTVQADKEIISRTKKERGSSATRWPVKFIVESGYAVITAHRDQIDPDNYRNDFSDGIHPLFYRERQRSPQMDEWGAIGAWAWALSRMLDYLETEEKGKVDAGKVAVIGHSRLGKTALWAGAQDKRFALVISNNSGCGGAALFRRCYGERIHHMSKNISYWFCRNHQKYRKKENELPVDQHMLLALIAPRPLYVASAEEDRWADPKGEFLSAKYAGAVYELYKKPNLLSKEMPKLNEPLHTTVGYHIRKGKHAITLYDWQQYVKFADRFMKEK